MDLFKLLKSRLLSFVDKEVPGKGVVEKPAETKPSKVAEKPPKVAEKPPKVAEKPPKVAEKPPKVADKPPKVAEKPKPAVSKQPKPPVITKELEDVDAEEGEKVTLEVEFSSESKPTVKWKKDAKVFYGSSRVKIVTDKNSSKLVFDKVKEDDEALYECIVKNAAGEVGTSGELVLLGKFYFALVIRVGLFKSLLTLTLN